jgi:hypothetical protein
MVVITRPCTLSRRTIGALTAPVIFCAFGVLGPACATTEGSLDAGLFHGGNVAFRVGRIPDGWRRIGVERASLAFRDEAHGASVLVDARCNPDEANTPLVALTEQLLMGTTERSFSAEETIPFDGREARHSVLTAKLDGVQMGYDVYVLKKDACTYDLVYVAPLDTFALGSRAFEGFALGFHTASTGGEG